MDNTMRIRRAFLIAIFSYILISCIVAVVLAEFAFHPLRVPVSKEFTARAIAPQPGANLKEVAVVSADGVQLKGWFAQPLNPNGNVVILLHGVGDNRQGMMGFATVFLSKGYTVLLPDSRGHGSSGGIPTYGIREVEDVVLWYKWLRIHCNTKGLYGMGESMGGAILLQALNRLPFIAVVAESPFANFRQIAYIRVGQFLHTGSWVGRTILRPSIELAFLYGWLTQGVWLPSASPEDSVAMTRVPVLLIHGLADASIPFQQSEKIFARRNGLAELWKVPKAGHCGASAIAGQEFYARILDWFALHDVSHKISAFN
jgi:hypothetical protein